MLIALSSVLITLPLSAFSAFFPEGKNDWQNPLSTGLAFFSSPFDRKCLPGFSARLRQWLPADAVGHLALSNWHIASLVTVSGNQDFVPLFRCLTSAACSKNSAASVGCWFFQRTFVRFLLTPPGGENRRRRTSFSLLCLNNCGCLSFAFLLWPIFHKMDFCATPRRLDVAIEPFPSFPGLCGYSYDRTSQFDVPHRSAIIA